MRLNLIFGLKSPLQFPITLEEQLLMEMGPNIQTFRGPFSYQIWDQQIPGYMEAQFTILITEDTGSYGGQHALPIFGGSPCR
jgi:hypothetical protein